MRRFLLVSLCMLAAMSLFLADSYGHSGGTNAEGCHTNRKTGDYHCHNSKAPQPGRVTYCHEVNGERRCGYAKQTCEDLKSQFGGSCRRE